jgi:hypothetical protein
MPKISQLPNASTLTGSEYVPIIQNGETRKALASSLGGGGGSPGGSNGQIQYNNSGAFGGVSNAASGLQVLRRNAANTGYEFATSSLDGVFVNVADYLDSGDPSPTIDGHTTKNIDLAMQRAYDAVIKTHQRLVLWIPPTIGYGVDSWSWRTSLTWLINATNDNVAYLEILGSGQAGIIIPDSNVVGANDKLLVASGGPDGMPTQFSYRNMFWCGTGAETDVDCLSILKTTADMQVLYEGNMHYGLLSSSAESLLDLSAMGLTSRRNYFFGCGNTNGSATLSFYSGLFGVRFEHTHWYDWERDVDPFGTPSPGAYLNKMGYDPANYAYSIWARGDTEENAPRIIAEQCAFKGAGNLGAFLLDPSADGFFIRSLMMHQCYVHANAKRTVRAVSNVRDITLTECRISHNDGGVDDIALLDASCKRLSLHRNTFSHSGLRIKANTGQESVIIRENTGGTFDVSDVANLEIESSTYDALTSTPLAASAVSSLDIDWASAEVFSKSLASGGNTFTFSNPGARRIIVVRLTSHGSGSTVTWPTVKWAGGTPPTQSTPSKTDVYTFVHDGTDIYGSVAQDMS